jgi:hypothetical protein
MGCQESKIRGNGANGDQQLDRPEVPALCWYAQPFNEECTQTLTPFHSQMRGNVCFGLYRIPTSHADLGPSLQPHVLDGNGVVSLSSDDLYGMAYLYDTALFTEHLWRTRVPHGARNRFERPFYDTLMTVKMFIDDVLVPDSAPHSDSVIGVTSTIPAPDALARWKLVPLVFLPNPRDTMMGTVRIFDSMIASFATFCLELAPGTHRLMVEVSYGCRNEDNFCAGYIAQGSVTLLADVDTPSRMSRLLSQVAQRIDRQGAPARYVRADGGARCRKCHMVLAQRCTVCGAGVCSSTACIFEVREDGYPLGCESHPPPS